MTPLSPLLKIYHTLFSHFGPQGWWPGHGELEISIGAILTQNTNWKNVTRSLEQLKKHQALDPGTIRTIDHQTLAGIIHSSGYHNQKSRKLKYFADWLERYNDNWQTIRNLPLERLRNELLSIWGIGEETADSILLYALDKPIFVIDTYTRRILSRHNLCRHDEKYQTLQNFFMRNLPPDKQLYNEYHALLVRAGKTYCQKHPKCRFCPLQSLKINRFL